MALKFGSRVRLTPSKIKQAGFEGSQDSFNGLIVFKNETCCEICLAGKDVRERWMIQLPRDRQALKLGWDKR